MLSLNRLQLCCYSDSIIGALGGTRIRNPLHGKEMRWPITLLTQKNATEQLTVKNFSCRWSIGHDSHMRESPWKGEAWLLGYRCKTRLVFYRALIIWATSSLNGEEGWTQTNDPELWLLIICCMSLLEIKMHSLVILRNDLTWIVEIIKLESSIGT